MPFDTFKNLDEVFESDLKRIISFEEFYKLVAEISLLKTVPQKIQSHFDIAKNLALYSWFVRRFHHIAELHSFSTVEFAIRTKIEIVTNANCKMRGLKRLLNYAMDQQWIVDDGFPEVIEKRKQQQKYRELLKEIPGFIFPDDTTDPQKYVKLLMRTFPTLRNAFAHGSSTLFPGSFNIMNTCRHLINQLFK